MNRKSFLKLSLAAGSSVALPAFANAQSSTAKRGDKGTKVPAGKDRTDKSISARRGDTFYVKVSTKETDGDLFIFESTRDKKGGPDLHYHFAQDEWWYILEGEFLFKVGDDTFTVKAGDSVFGPRMIPHAFAKTNEGSARMLIAFQPAGKMEEYFVAVSQGALVKLSEEEGSRFKKAHGFEVVGPALTHEEKA